MNAKHHKYAKVFVDGDSVTINGEPQPYVGKSRREARRASHVLSEAVGAHLTARGVIVIVNAGELTIRQQPDDVLVVDKRRLCRWLLSVPCVQDRVIVEAVFEVARRFSAWW